MTEDNSTRSGKKNSSESDIAAIELMHEEALCAMTALMEKFTDETISDMDELKRQYNVAKSTYENAKNDLKNARSESTEIPKKNEADNDPNE